MSREEKNMERKKWLAAVMGMTMPGMGQIYNGEMIKGVSYFAIFLALFATGFRWTVLLPDRLLIIGALVTLTIAIAVFAMIIIDAYRKAGKIGTDYRLKSYNRWYFYLAVWLLGSVLVSGSVYDYLKNNIIEAYKIVTTSMEPVILEGDRVFADKTAYRRMPPKKGDIILFVYPDDRSKVFIKRLEGLPGDMIVRSNGGKEQVPHGTIYVLGDNKDQSVDSRTFGFVPLRDLIGKVRQVYYSSTDEGVRWDRIGTTLGGS
ncbi:MAG: signal peptidase I [Nitrospirae bacterium GWD2_57_9]|nr:MAG: signal peptidase I [Nitrospirae bacterium GWD2_57_9]